jgi:hypothetical protein
MAGLITIYIAAGLLEALGIYLAYRELRDAKKRLQLYKESPPLIDLRPAEVTTTASPLTIHLDPPPPLETRAQVMEDPIQQLREQRAEDVVQLKDYARKEAGEASEYVEASVRREVTRVADLVFALNDPERPGWQHWWLGLAMIAAGLVLGVIGNIVSVCLTT